MKEIGAVPKIAGSPFSAEKTMKKMFDGCGET